ncbi:single-stranded DNA-binding protein [uncultured Sneathia sp.]|uniref:single-stranded DNA-binding protein n=1 Tax=uncultured Sneathia sp. TaxID=278067 RepID=UPI00259BC4F3|nr:single-stranded DNA-binding protein [uncultured Sneathia sp.]
MNNVTLMGRLTRDPELKRTSKDNSYCNFTLAVNRPKIKDNPQKADFIPCTAWNKTAEVIESWLQKGDRLIVMGRLNVTKNDDKYYTNVIVEKINFIDTVRTSEEKKNEAWIEPIEDDELDEGFPF